MDELEGPAVLFEVEPLDVDVVEILAVDALDVVGSPVEVDLEEIEAEDDTVVDVVEDAYVVEELVVDVVGDVVAEEDVVGEAELVAVGVIVVVDGEAAEVEVLEVDVVCAVANVAVTVVYPSTRTGCVAVVLPSSQCWKTKLP